MGEMLSRHTPSRTCPSAVTGLDALPRALSGFSRGFTTLA